MKHARDLSHEQLVNIVDDIQQILYLNANAQGMIWDPAKEWDCEAIDYVDGVLTDAGLKPEREMPREPAGEDNRLTAIIEQLVALDEANHDVQFAVDDLIYDEIGTGKHASNINNQGIANQADALVDRIGPEDAIQALQAVLDNFTQPSEVIVVEPAVVDDRQVITDLVDKVSLQKHPTRYVSSVTVIDPDTNDSVKLEIRKDLHTQAMIGIDASFLEQDVGPVYDPYNPRTELDIRDDESEPHAAIRTMQYELNIDFTQLRDQKAALLEQIGNNGDHPLTGLIHLLDAIQDQAADVHGMPEVEVFGVLVDQ